MKARDWRSVLMAAACLVVVLTAPSSGQLVMSNLGAINQNFDTLGSSTNLPSYWRTAFGMSFPAWSRQTNTVGFATNSGSPTANAMYNWGDSGWTNRSIGSLRTSSAGTDNIILYAQNRTGSTISSFSVGYALKQFYRGGSGGYVNFYYSTNGTSWTEVIQARASLTASNFTTPPAEYLFSAPNTLSVPAATFSNLQLAPESGIYFRWAVTTSGNGVGVGIDDIWITPVTSSIAPSDFTYQSASGGIAITGYTGTAAAVTIPPSINGQTVVGIGSGAFAQRTGITLVELPDTVAFIDDGAFHYCTKLSSINLPPGLRSVGRYAFAGCEKLVSVTLPVSITDLGEGAFTGCSALTDLTISHSLTQIDIPPEAFRDCVSLRNVTIPGSVAVVGDGAFYGCVNLSSVWLQPGVEQLGAAVFQNCYSISSVTLSSTLKFIGAQAFMNCASLTSVSFGSALTQIVPTMFVGCDSLASITVSAANPALSSVDGALLSKSQTQLITVPPGKSGVYEVPWGVTTIVSTAFAGCSELSSITLPQTASGSSIDLQDCTGLTSAILPEGLSVNFPDSGAPLGVLRYTVDGSSIAVAGYERRNDWNSPDFSPMLPDSVYGLEVRHIVEYTFAGLPITRITIPSNVRTIGNQAFRNCSLLTSVNLGNGVIAIGDYAFAGSALTSITIPSSLTSLGKGSLVGGSLTWIQADSGSATFSSIDGVLFSKDQATLIQYPMGRFGAYSVPNNVTHIADYAFFESSVDSITIPSSVISVGSAVFDNSSVSTVLFRGNAPTQLADDFLNGSGAAVFRLPGASGWDSVPLATSLFQPLAGHASFVAGSMFQITWSNTSSIPMSVQRSTSLNGPWTVVSSNNSTGSYIDSTPPAERAFYRAILP